MALDFAFNAMRAIIFDMDGVLIDSEPYWQEAQKRVFLSLGIRLSDDDCQQTMGLRTDEVVDLWFDRSPWKGPRPRDVSEMIVDRVIELVNSEGEALPFVNETLQSVTSLPIQVALASSSPMRLIEAVCAQLGIRSHFQVVCTGMDEARGKPDPSVYLTTASRLNVSPGSCLVVEDSVAGVEAGKSAGMVTVAIPPAHLYADPRYDGADLKLRSLGELDLDHVLIFFGDAS